MGQVYTIEEFSKLNPKSLISWEDIVSQEFQKHTATPSVEESNPFASLAAQSRLFYPRSFSVSPSLTSLNTPWFIDYGHLMFWFFFLSTFLIVMWLVTLHSLASRHIETRFPKRETRGFSRAQTGDVMTAVLPLTWSITMLMHASTHSINFDENTAATVFSFTVVAYQWGWNYYFPRDIITKVARGPRIVGRGGIDLNGSNLDYNFLLEKARFEYLSRMGLRGNLADKSGKEVMSAIINTYARATSAPQTTHMLPEIGLLTAASATGFSSQLWRSTVNAAFNETPQTLNVPSSNASWLLSSTASARFNNPELIKSQNNTNTLLQKAPYPYLLNNKQINLNPIAAFNNDAVSNYETAPQRLVNNAAKSAASLFLVGNRLSLIHKHLSNPQKLLNDKTKLSQLFNKYVNNYSSNATISSLKPSWSTKAPHSNLFDLTNVVPNLWFYQQSPLKTFKNPNPFIEAQLFGFKLTKNLNLTSKLSLAKNRGFSHKTQQTLFSGSPYSLGYKSNNLITPEDIGFTNNAVSKEFTRKVLNQSAVNSLLRTGLTNKISISNVGLNVGLSAQNNFQRRLLLSTNYNQINSKFNYIPSTTNTKYNKILNNFIFSQEMAGLKSLWNLLASPSVSSNVELLHTASWSKGLPGINIKNSQLLKYNVSNTVLWFTPVQNIMQFGTRSNTRAVNQLSNPSTTTTPIRLYQPNTNTIVSFFKKPCAQNSVLFVKPVKLVVNSIIAQSLPSSPENLFFWKPNIKAHRNLINTTPTSLANASRIPLFNMVLSQQNSPLALQGLVIKNLTKKPAVYSAYLEGPMPARPVRVAGDKTNDPFNFAGKAEFLTGQPVLNNFALYQWYWAWTDSTKLFAYPTYKITRGSIIKKPLSLLTANNFPVASDYKNDLRVDKGSWLTPVVLFKQRIVRPANNPTSFAALDSELTQLSPTNALLTPEPGEDIDQNFVHQKWTTDINTTRRSDHVSKFKVTWGPWANFKKTPEVHSVENSSANAYAGVVGSSTVNGLSVRTSQTMAVYNENVIPFKTTPGLTKVFPLAQSGAFAIQPNIGSTLINGLLPEHAKKTTAHNSVIRFKANWLSKGIKQKPLKSFTSWYKLWTFKTTTPDSTLTTQRLNINTTNSYWSDKALLALTLKQNMLTKLNKTGPYTLPNTGFGLGANHPLLSDIRVASSQAKNEIIPSLNKNVWHSSAGSLGIISSAYQIVDDVVNAHLVSRANYTLSSDEIGSIRRLRVTKGIYLPSDTPMHVICGSKDVIHSWALPGLNVKIDCIPGFNSHRRLLLRWRGAYWGQCMEVCGRYHHWMPILIHVVHKDIFLSWCLTYLRLVEARAQETSRALAVIATVDLVSLDSTLASLLKTTEVVNPYAQINNFIVSSDLDE